MHGFSAKLESFSFMKAVSWICCDPAVCSARPRTNEILYAWEFTTTTNMASQWVTLKRKYFLWQDTYNILMTRRCVCGTSRVRGTVQLRLETHRRDFRSTCKNYVDTCWNCCCKWIVMECDVKSAYEKVSEFAPFLSAAHMWLFLIDYSVYNELTTF